jgi:nucleoside-diphosphate-sugar epimerase
VPTLDVVIEALGGSDVVAIQDAVYEAVRTAASSRPAGSAKISYIYTSGTWVHGDNRHTGQVVTDNTPLTAPAELVAWRPAKEARILQDDVLNGIVIRPALLYGKGGSIFESAFRSASDGKVRWPGPAGGRLSLIHCDDLADLYVRVSERAQVLGGRAFDAANDISESVDDVLAQLVRVSGASGPAELYEPTNGMQ